MWRSKRSSSGVDRFLITMVTTIILLSATSPMVSVAAAKVIHSRVRRAVPERRRPAAVQEPATAEKPKQLSQVLAGLEVSQSALEKEASDLEAAMTRRMNQLSTDLGDSQKQTQQMLEKTNQRINSIQRLFKFIVLMFVLSLGGVLYNVLQPVRVRHSRVKWKGKIPEMSPEEERISAWPDDKPANGPSRKLDIRPDTVLVPPPR
jgi:ABC-type multidrug transport system fused ATPase/permease subunit